MPLQLQQGDERAQARPNADANTRARTRAQGMGMAAASFFPHYEPSWAGLVAERRGELDAVPDMAVKTRQVFADGLYDAVACRIR